MPLFLFASDLHGKPDRYKKLCAEIYERKPFAVLLGGDLLPHGMAHGPDFDDFFHDFDLCAYTRTNIVYSCNHT